MGIGISFAYITLSFKKTTYVYYYQEKKENNAAGVEDDL